MPRWIAVPQCPECEDPMRDVNEGNYECVSCGAIMFDEGLDL